MTDFVIVTEAQRIAWALGDLSRLAARLPTLYAELLCERLDLRPGERVLDVAAGTGTTSIAAARRFCQVTATDFVPESLARARALADGEELPLETRVADMQELPFEDGAFDVVLSTFGVMFAPDQERAANELLRVVRPGGRIGVAAWTPDGVVGEYARAIGRRRPPPPGLRSPFEWGTEARVTQLLGQEAESLKRTVAFRYPSVEFAVDYFRRWYGPARGVYEWLDEAGRKVMQQEASTVWAARNEARDGSLVAPADYLESVIVKG